MLFYCQNLGGGMSEYRPGNNGWESKIESIHKDIRLILEHVARQTFINEHHKNSIDEISKEVDALEIKVSTLQNKSASQDGGLGVLRILLGLCGGSLLAACIWVGSSIIQINQTQSLLNEKVARLEETLK